MEAGAKPGSTWSTSLVGPAGCGAAAGPAPGRRIIVGDHDPKCSNCSALVARRSICPRTPLTDQIEAGSWASRWLTAPSTTGPEAHGLGKEAEQMQPAAKSARSLAPPAPALYLRIGVYGPDPIKLRLWSRRHLPDRLRQYLDQVALITLGRRRSCWQPPAHGMRSWVGPDAPLRDMLNPGG